MKFESKRVYKCQNCGKHFDKCNTEYSYDIMKMVYICPYCNHGNYDDNVVRKEKMRCKTCGKELVVIKDRPYFGEGEPSPECVNSKCPESKEWLLKQTDPDGYPIDKLEMQFRKDEAKKKWAKMIKLQNAQNVDGEIWSIKK